MPSQAERTRHKRAARKVAPVAPCHAPADPSKPRTVSHTGFRTVTQNASIFSCLHFRAN
jgi:hypothetical protein